MRCVRRWRSSNFSEAVEPPAGKRGGNRVRPSKRVGEPLDDHVLDVEGEENIDLSEGEEEVRPVAGQSRVHQPTKDEWDEHMRTHLPFRKWCPFCVKGRSKNSPHTKSKKSEDDLANEVPVISMDYMGPKSKEDRSKQIDSLPIIVGKDRISKWVFAHVVPKKGHDAHAIKVIKREINLSGYNRVIIKSDQEPSI